MLYFLDNRRFGHFNRPLTLELLKSDAYFLVRRNRWKMDPQSSQSHRYSAAYGWEPHTRHVPRKIPGMGPCSARWCRLDFQRIQHWLCTLGDSWADGRCSSPHKSRREYCQWRGRCCWNRRVREDTGYHSAVARKQQLQGREKTGIEEDMQKHKERIETKVLKENNRKDKTE